MPYTIYKILHLLGIVMLFVALGGTLVHAGNRLEKGANALRASLAALHGVGLVLIVVAGFGMLAKLGMGGVPGWAGAKIVIWLLLAVVSMLPYRRPSWSGALLWLLPLLAAVAAYLAIYKPL